jgi:hypothetical protein
MVSEQRVKTCQYTVLRPVTYQKTVQGCRLEAKQVPYTKTVCVPKLVKYQVPVQVYKKCL